jgi:hypothetical protein
MLYPTTKSRHTSHHNRSERTTGPFKKHYLTSIWQPASFGKNLWQNFFNEQQYSNAVSAPTPSWLQNGKMKTIIMLYVQNI